MATSARIEDELIAAQRQLVEAQKLARIGSWEWDIPANAVWWSDELYRIYGLDPRSIAPSYEGFLKYVHEDDRESVDERNRKAFADHEPFEDVKRVVREDGRVILMRTQGEVICAEDGSPLRMVGICEDVTDQLRREGAERELAAANALRHRAADINDEIIQRLVLCSNYMIRGDRGRAIEMLSDTRRRAQRIHDELLDTAGVKSGDLRRDAPAA